MRLVRPPFVFFSSTRSELLDYFDFVIGDKAEGWQNLQDYQKISVHVTMNKTAQYEDNILQISGSLKIKKPFQIIIM